MAKFLRFSLKKANYGNFEHLPECHKMNELHHLVLLEERTIVCLNGACDVIDKRKELQTRFAMPYWLF